jgi:hypothetical protein
MILSAPVMKTLLMSASLGMVVPMLAQTPPPRAKAVKDGTEAERPLPGTVIPRGEGFASLAIEGGHFLLRFFDAARRQVAPPGTRATVRWNSPLKTGESRGVLNAAPDGLALAGNQYVHPPHVFKVYLTLLDAEGASVESHIFDVRQ